MIRCLTFAMIFGISATAIAADPGPDGEIERQFAATVRPFLDTYCLTCHGHDKPKGDMDLSVYPTVDAVAHDFARWEVVLEQIESKVMPPAKAPNRPSDDARRAMVAWVKAVRKREATRNAGDPGSVPGRRLSNAEYDHTIRDLTGVDIRPTKEFPVDPANEAGFDNSAESLTMSPALVKKYLEAARLVSDHVVLKPEGFDFAPHPVVADTDRDKYSVRRIIDFYARQRLDLADYFEAAWRYQHRKALGRPDVTLDDLARDAKLSPRYLDTLWTTLNERAKDRGPIAAVQALWRDLPGPVDGKPLDSIHVRTQELRDFVVELRAGFVPEVKNLTSPTVQNGAQPLVIWKDREMARNRRRYAGVWPDRAKITKGTPEARALALPESPKDVAAFEASFRQFCSIFPDAFLVKERARIYLDARSAKGNEGRLLSAGFHSMTGYFRDDQPLYDLMLDDQGRAELDRLWVEFDFVTGAPLRQYLSHLWFERTDSRFMSEAEFDFARAEDRDAGSEAKLSKLADVYIAKARRKGAGEVALKAMRDYYDGISASIRAVEKGRIAAEPSHIKALERLAERAYRRPLAPAERAGITAFYRTLRDADGLSHEDAVRDSVVGILMSPHFCYRMDLTSAGLGLQPLSDYALASRLSYFLWSSMPDDELLAHAKAGDLHRPEVIVSQAKRMLKDDKVRGLATEFGGNWLDFRRFEEHNSVDRGRFPSFDDDLRRAMFEEPVQFFIDVVRRDLPVRTFLEGSHTFVNPVLARHYGMPEPSGWTRIDDASRYGRGGLLPMAVFMTKNAPGLRTSPVKRGYWVVRRLLGEKIPAPPATVPELPSDEAKLGDLTLRQALAQHRADKACAGCHDRFDSIGLAFEGFGPIGERRKVDLGGRLVDTRATFPDGQEGRGLDGLKTYLQTSRRDDFTENLNRKLLAYALGRNLLPSDDLTLDDLRHRLASSGDRFGSLIEGIVTSRQFLNKRVEGDQAE